MCLQKDERVPLTYMLPPKLKVVPLHLPSIVHNLLRVALKNYEKKCVWHILVSYLVSLLFLRNPFTLEHVCFATQLISICLNEDGFSRKLHSPSKTFAV